MSISLNNVNSEVVRAHKRIDGIKIPGVGQKWHNVTGSRAKNTNYTNNHGVIMQVSVSWNTGTNGPNYGYVIVDGIRVAAETNQGWSGYRTGAWAAVPPGSVYQVQSSAGIEVWAEMY